MREMKNVAIGPPRKRPDGTDAIDYGLGVTPGQPVTG